MIVAHAAVEGIASHTADKGVIPRTTVKRVVATSTFEGVVAAVTVERIGARRSVQSVGSIGAIVGVGAGVGDGDGDGIDDRATVAVVGGDFNIERRQAYEIRIVITVRVALLMLSQAGELLSASVTE